MLEFFTPTNSSRIASSKQPCLSVGPKTGYIQFNVSLCEVVGLNEGDKVRFACDAKAGKWFLVKVGKKEEGFELINWQRKRTAKRTSLKFTCRNLAARIVREMKLDPKAATTLLNVDVENPVTQEGYITYQFFKQK